TKAVPAENEVATVWKVGRKTVLVGGFGSEAVFLEQPNSKQSNETHKTAAINSSSVRRLFGTWNLELGTWNFIPRETPPAPSLLPISVSISGCPHVCRRARAVFLC